MKVKVKATLKNLRISPRKVRVSTDMIRSCNVVEAIFRLENTVKKANEPVRKLIESAIANAQNNFDLKIEDLMVADIQVGEGITLKRWMPRAYGRATQILKRSSHVYLTLESDNAEKKKIVKKVAKKAVATDNTEGSEKTVDKTKIDKGDISKNVKKGYFKAEGKKKESREKGWSKKIFKRKSV